jgi:hypothetical protein
MNAFTGERHAYGTLFMKEIFRAAVRPLFVWYDINCKWAGSLWKWLARQPADIQRLAAALQFPLPRMHFYAHG